jgi:hypothetical protein
MNGRETGDVRQVIERASALLDAFASTPGHPFSTELIRSTSEQLTALTAQPSEVERLTKERDKANELLGKSSLADHQWRMEQRDKLWKAEAEIAVLKADLERARYAPLGDNHHNAAACPHCRPQLASQPAPSAKFALGFETGAEFERRKGEPAPSGWQQRCERVANGLETALSFTSRLDLDTAVRVSIKELRGLWSAVDALPPAPEVKQRGPYSCDEEGCEWFGDEPNRAPDGVTSCPACGSVAINEPAPDAKDVTTGTILGGDGRHHCEACGRTDISDVCDERSCPIRRRADAKDAIPPQQPRTVARLCEALMLAKPTHYASECLICGDGDPCPTLAFIAKIDALLAETVGDAIPPVPEGATAKPSQREVLDRAQALGMAITGNWNEHMDAVRDDIEELEKACDFHIRACELNDGRVRDLKRQVEDLANDRAAADAEAAQLRAELNVVDNVLARRPALDKPTRWENIEHAIATAARADQFEAEATKLRQENEGLRERLENIERGWRLLDARINNAMATLQGL